MRIRPLPTALFCILCAFSAAAAETPPTGFYLGGGAGFGDVDATGAWGGTDFRASAPFPVEDGDAIGMAWSDNILLGISPTLGVRVDPVLALELVGALHVPKTSTRYYYDSDASTYYEDRTDVVWKQRSLKLRGVVHPTPDRRLRLSAGVLRTTVVLDVTNFASFQSDGAVGDATASDTTGSSSDGITATGLVLGAGYDFPLADGRSVVYLDAEYASCATDGALLDVDGFAVELGGFSVSAGIRWFPFR